MMTQSSAVVTSCRIGGVVMFVEIMWILTLVLVGSWRECEMQGGNEFIVSFSPIMSRLLTRWLWHFGVERGPSSAKRSAESRGIVGNTLLSRLMILILRVYLTG